MHLTEIEHQIIDPLSREEKEALFKYLAKELEKEDLLQYFIPGEMIDYHGPVIEPKIAHHLEDFMNKEKK